MQSIQRVSSLAVAVLAALSCTEALAQNIVITNANNHQIPLASGSSVQIDVNGNLLAQCALTNGTCTQLSNGGPQPGTPTASLARNDGLTTVTNGQAIRLTWDSTNSQLCLASSSGPAGATTFAGPRGTSNASGESVTLSTVGSYTFGLKCYNDAGASQNQATAVTVTQSETPPPPPSGCDITSSDPAFQPAGFAAVTKEWSVAFKSPNPNITTTPVYPTSPGTPVPIGSSKNAYTAIRFVALANMTVDMTWDTAQASTGYSMPRPADSMFISISPCAGDLRAPDAASGDPWLQPGCRKVAGAASMYYTTRTNYVSNDFLCRIEAGQTYFINVSPVDTTDGLSPGEHTCSTTAPNSANGCDVQMRHSGS
jgi:hypothetical protein